MNIPFNIPKPLITGFGRGGGGGGGGGGSSTFIYGHKQPPQSSQPSEPCEERWLNTMKTKILTRNN